MSLAQGKFCDINKYDAEDPRCAHIILTGKVVKIEKGSDEEQFARNALFNRHPEMHTWPKGKANDYVTS